MMSSKSSLKVCLILTTLLITVVGGCSTQQTNNSEQKTPDASPITSPSPAYSLPNQANTNKETEKRNKMKEEFFAEGPPIDLPQCMAMETQDIAAMQAANFPDDEIRQNIFAIRNIVRTEKDPAKQALVCQRMMEMRQKNPYQTRAKK